MAYPHGRFVWYGLTTTDLEAAKAFYSKVVGWGTQDASVPGMTYTLFTADATPVCGLMELPEDARQMGVRPSWLGYVGVDDVDAAADQINHLGGAVYVPPQEIPNVSRFSVVADPQAATLALIRWLNPRRQQPAEPGKLGRVGWHELLAVDWEQALGFYGKIFGWHKADADVGEIGTYQLFAAGADTIGGMFNKPPALPGPFWFYYFNIGDIDAAAERVKACGGRIFEGPVAVPGSWVARCVDPQGAVFGLEGKRREAVGYFERTAARDPSDPRGRRWYW